MKKILPLLITLFSFGLILGQDLSQFDVRLGAGWSLATSGDYITNTLDAEVNYHVSDYFSVGTGFAVGSSFAGDYGNMSFVHHRWTAFVSPLANNRLIDLRAGVGPAAYLLSEIREVERRSFDGTQYSIMEFTNSLSLGFNVTLESQLNITDRLFIGGTIVSQFYRGGDLNHALLGRVGVRL